MSPRITIGADPELFVRNTKTGQFVSGHGMISGTKKEPYKILNGAVQVDGTALEFNIDPCSTVQEFLDKITAVRASMQGMIPGHELVNVPSVCYDPEYYKTIPDDAKAMGCDPDFSAYTGNVNPRPTKLDPTLHAAGGHVHIGWTNNVDPHDPIHFRDCMKLVKQLDVYLGIPSLLYDKDKLRRQIYGAPGSFRPKPYGVEYRTLSNAWLATPGLIQWVYNTTMKATTDLMLGKIGDKTQYSQYAQTWFKKYNGVKGACYLSEHGHDPFNTGVPLPPDCDLPPSLKQYQQTKYAA